jgi:hypothetical protein
MYISTGAECKSSGATPIEVASLAKMQEPEPYQAELFKLHPA